MLRNRMSSSNLILALGSLLGVLAFSWPLYIPNSRIFLLQPNNARYLSLVVAIAAVTLIAIQISTGTMDSKSVAILGVLAALIAALRLIGAGAVGIEPMWFLLILASYAFGAKFGFALGVVSMATSALLTGGIGPWLAFQMLAAGWIGLISGAAQKFRTDKYEKVLLVLLGVTASLSFGLLMDLQLWPWLIGTDTQLSYIAGGALQENLSRFLVFHLSTALAWDLPRAITTGALIWLTSKPVLNSFRRAQLRLFANGHVMQQKVHA